MADMAKILRSGISALGGSSRDTAGQETAKVKKVKPQKGDTATADENNKETGITYSNSAGDKASTKVGRGAMIDKKAEELAKGK